jgi:hypothetical protein
MPDQLITYYIQKSLDGYIYKQWDLGGWVMVIRLAVDFGELVNVALTGGIKVVGG